MPGGQPGGGDGHSWIWLIHNFLTFVLINFFLSILNYIRTWSCKHIFSTNCKKISSIFAELTKIFEKSEMAGML